ncbi:MAG: enoyl-CoA hydratase/isomerase family protein [Candidatus Sericytochromatia bacterium]
MESSEKSFSKLKVEQGEITVITILGNTDLNLLHYETIKELYDTLVVLEKDKNIRVLILTGDGNKAFCAGADIKELANLSEDLLKKYVEEGTITYDKIENFPCPVIACVNGYAFGAGFELALACDIRFLSENAKMGQPAVKHGLIPPFGGLRRLPKVVGLAKAKEIIFSAINFNASEALKLGVANKVFKHSELLEEAKKFAQTICKNKSYSITFSKNILNSLFTSNTYQEEIDKLTQCLSNDYTKERLNSFFNT